MENKKTTKTYITIPKKDENEKLEKIDLTKAIEAHSSSLNQLAGIIRAIIDATTNNMDYIYGMSSATVKLAQKLVEKIQPLIEIMTDYYIKYTPYLEKLGKAINEAINNPDSLINWYNYGKKLSDYLWTIPFDIESTDLNKIFEQINSEKEFDDYIDKYFTDKKINSLFLSIENILPSKHKLIFKQLKQAFFNRSYALMIIGIMAIIDDLCSYFLINKEQSGRQGLFVPIINDLDKKDFNNFLILDLMILSNNIDVIYESVEFNGKIRIDTHKKARRNPCMHGKTFSNRKIDALMLLNTMYNLLIICKELKEYKGKIAKKNNNKFYIPTDVERRSLKRKIKGNIQNKKNVLHKK